MENLRKVPGIVLSGNKSVDAVYAKQELEKKKQLYNSVNLSRLPDNGARIKKQIDELEDILKALSLERSDGDGSCDVLSQDKENESKSGKDSVTFKKKCDSNEHVGGKSSSTNTAYKNAPDNTLSDFTPKEIVKNDGANMNSPSFKTWRDPKNRQKTIFERSKSNAEHEGKKNIETNIPDENALDADTFEKKYLSFSDLTPSKAVKDVGENMNSPSFKTWRDPKNLRKTLLTEPKPLVEKPGSKASASHYFTSTHYIQSNEECAKKMHNLLVTYPDDSKEESEPESLKSSLMMHQKQALAWLMWREQQDPSGGILADDMGLGKTLTMISLILKQKEMHIYSSFKEEEYECRGTLIVCVASIIHQWKEEIDKHCENDSLNVYLYHGQQRDKSIKNMMAYDVVLTTYNIVMSERKAMNNTDFESPLFKLKWERIILDEAHTIKNHASQTAQAIFTLRAFRKWAVTGTPIHNIFKDIYALVKFLRFSPFDENKKFKELTDNNSEQCEQRRSLLIKSIVLRRTKEQVDEWGKPLIEMRTKSFSLCYIELSAEERRIYDKLNEKVTKKFSQYFKNPSHLRSNSSLLVLLLRLQQCCNHLSLLKDEVDEPDVATDISSTLSSLSINETVSDSNASSDSLNLTFNESEMSELNDASVKSSKIKELFKKLYDISECSVNDKCVIVSQWVSMLNIIAYHLENEGITYHMIVGSTKVEDRQKYADDFNYNNDGAKIMLLSLKAGGVGLNLIGANHLFLLDLHWNPALEMQACDRIHRVGQKKDVIIHKFICKNTIEERIKTLQDMKRGIASSALRGIKHNTTGLTIEDFKMLFSIRK